MHSNRYDSLTKAFHWATALLILALFPLGVIANDWPYDTNEALATKAQLFSIHKTLGVAVFFVALARIGWALTRRKPGPLHPDRKAETFLADLVHWLLYISLVIVPLSGWIHHAATEGFAPIWWPFGQSLPLVPKDEAVAGLFAGIHWLMTKVMIAAVLLHIAGALKHHIVDKDATLRRIWFGRPALPDVPPHRTNLPAALGALAIAAGGVFVGSSFAGEEEPLATAAPLAAVASDWTVTDGTLSLTVRQLGNDVTGSFADWTSEIAFDPDATGEAGSVRTTIAIGSLTLGSVTSQAMGPDFFDASAHPTALYEGPILTDGEGYRVDGTLTLKGTSAAVPLPFDLVLDGDTATMTGSTTIDRLTFAIGETMADESNLGFPVVVDITLTATRSE